MLHLNRYQEAVTSCNKALEIQPKDAQAWIFRGAALHRLGRYAEAYDSYDKALGNSDPSGWRKNLSKLMGWVMGNG
jgi:Flp pilus assembly protein TadD